MSQSTFDDDELFAEATEEIQADVEAAIARANEQLPTDDDLSAVDDETVPAVLDSVEAELTIEPIEDALAAAQKAFLVGQRADAFDDEYVTETEATIAQLRDATTILREIETATVTLGDALSTLETLLAEPPLEASHDSDTQPDSASEAEPSETDNELTDSSTDSAVEASDEVSGEQNEAATPETEQVDPADPTDE